MDAKHWDNLAETFEDAVMSSLHADKNRVLEAAIKKFVKKTLVLRIWDVALVDLFHCFPGVQNTFQVPISRPNALRLQRKNLQRKKC